MRRQSESEGAFTRPYTRSHTFTRLGAVCVKVERREACHEGPEVLEHLRLGNSNFVPREPVCDEGGGRRLPWGEDWQHELVSDFYRDVSRWQRWYIRTARGDRLRLCRLWCCLMVGVGVIPRGVFRAVETPYASSSAPRRVDSGGMFASTSMRATHVQRRAPRHNIRKHSF